MDVIRIVDGPHVWTLPMKWFTDRLRIRKIEPADMDPDPRLIHDAVLPEVVENHETVGV